MFDPKPLNNTELIAKLMESCREGWPVPMEKCRDELLSRLTPTGDVAELLDDIFESLESSSDPNFVAIGAVEVAKNRLQRFVAALQQENIELAGALEFALTGIQGPLDSSDNSQFAQAYREAEKTLATYHEAPHD